MYPFQTANTRRLVLYRYYPMLKPYVHYIPVEARPDGSTDLIEQIDWAENNPDKVGEIVSESTKFAIQHLLPTSSRDCYSIMLLEKYSGLIKDIEKLKVPKKAQFYPSGSIA